MANTRMKREPDADERGGAPDGDPDDGIRTMMGAPMGGAPPQGAPAGRPDWGALMQRFGGAQQQPGGIMGGPGQSGPLPQGGMQHPQFGAMGGQAGGPWGQRIQQAIQALSQRFGQRPQTPQFGAMGGGGAPQGGGQFGAMQRPWMQQQAPGGQAAPAGGNAQPGGIMPRGWGQY